MKEMDGPGGNIRWQNYWTYLCGFTGKKYERKWVCELNHQKTGLLYNFPTKEYDFDEEQVERKESMFFSWKKPGSTQINSPLYHPDVGIDR